MLESLASYYRPKTFDECLGQDITLTILKRQIESKNISNCYILCGPSGVGKTSIARIFANSINGSVIEVDAASNNSVDNIRTIIDEAQLRALDAIYKVFIIDEAHMITTAGWNAFLKTLEEPPTYTIFILCTTNSDKIPDTIQNRCIKFNLSKVDTNLINDKLKYICKQERVIDYEDTCNYISKICNGSVRTAITMLEKVLNYSTNLNLDTTLNILGSYSYQSFIDITNALVDNNEKDLLGALDKIIKGDKELKSFVSQYLNFVLDLTNYLIFRDINLTQFPPSLEKEIKYVISFEYNLKTFNYMIDYLLKLKNDIRYDDNIDITLKASFICLLNNLSKLWNS